MIGHDLSQVDFVEQIRIAIPTSGSWMALRVLPIPDPWRIKVKTSTHIPVVELLGRVFYPSELPRTSGTKALNLTWNLARQQDPPTLASPETKIKKKGKLEFFSRKRYEFYGINPNKPII